MRNNQTTLKIPEVCDFDNFLTQKKADQCRQIFQPKMFSRFQLLTTLKFNVLILNKKLLDKLSMIMY